MQFEVVRNIKDFKSLENEWDLLFDRCENLSVFQTFIFNYSSWKEILSQSSSNSLFIIKIIEDHITIGILPFYNDKNKVSLRDFYKKLITIRKQNSCLRSGSFKTLFADGMIYSFLRSDDESSIAVVINNDTKRNKITIPLIGEKKVDLITNIEYLIEDGMLEIELDSMTGAILK